MMSVNYGIKVFRLKHVCILNRTYNIKSYRVYSTTRVWRSINKSLVQCSFDDSRNCKQAYQQIAFQIKIIFFPKTLVDLLLSQVTGKSLKFMFWRTFFMMKMSFIFLISSFSIKQRFYGMISGWQENFMLLSHKHFISYFSFDGNGIYV
jgi:hypothetical protein